MSSGQSGRLWASYDHYKWVYEAQNLKILDFGSKFGYTQKNVSPLARRIFCNRRKIITMTCRVFSGSSDACAPEFTILGKSYLNIFYLASKCYTNLIGSRTWFFATPGWAAHHPRSRAPRAGGRIACVWDHLEKCAFSATITGNFINSTM